MTRPVAICASVALVIAILSLPYGYYQVLRLGVCAAGIYCGVKLRSAGEEKWAYGLFFVALVFNPFLPVFLSRATWMPIDLVCAAVFGYVAYKYPATAGEGRSGISSKP
ncbi:DUF6804 family protein [Mesorhizobium sp.]|uniref:DUF6804 family protein n=1 Tax=Mesorhizobium sp. TaxID=1871066 RepID=UPI0026B1DD94